MVSKEKTVAGYLKSLPEDRRKALARIRAVVRRVIPQVTERMFYGMPCCFWRGQPVFAFASQVQYMSLYVDPVVMKEFKPRLGKLNCGKCCIRFRKLEDLPMDVAEGMVRRAVQRVRSGEYVYSTHTKTAAGTAKRARA